MKLPCFFWNKIRESYVQLCFCIFHYFAMPGFDVSASIEWAVSTAKPHCYIWYYDIRQIIRSSQPKMFLGKDALKICSKFTGEDSCQSVISIKFQSKFIGITLQHWCSPVNLLHIFRTTFPKNTSGGRLIKNGLCINTLTTSLEFYYW